MYMYICIHVVRMHEYIYIYIYGERERERCPMKFSALTRWVFEQDVQGISSLLRGRALGTKRGAALSPSYHVLYLSARKQLPKP